MPYPYALSLCPIPMPSLRGPLLTPSDDGHIIDGLRSPSMTLWLRGGWSARALTAVLVAVCGTVLVAQKSSKDQKPDAAAAAQAQAQQQEIQSLARVGADHADDRSRQGPVRRAHPLPSRRPARDDRAAAADGGSRGRAGGRQG